MKKWILALTTATLSIGAFADEPATSATPTYLQDVEDQAAQRLNTSRQKLSKFVRDDASSMQNFDLLAQKLYTAYRKEKSLSAQEIEKIAQALDFASEKHRFQTRKNKEKTPYISHPLGVTFNLMEIGQVREAAVIMGALLHDTVEDTKTTYSEIEKNFGKDVSTFVSEVSDDNSLPAEERKRLQVINAPHKSKGAAQIKLADKLFNVQDLLNNPPEGWSQTRIDRYFEWAQSVLNRLPAANAHLKTAVDGIIQKYWETQEAKDAT